MKSIIATHDVTKTFVSRGRQYNAVAGVSLDLMPGETLAVVGESGSGKTTLGRLIAGLYAPTKGAVFFDGNDISTLRDQDKNHWRRQVQMIFQDPYGSLNPRMTIHDIINEGISIHNLLPRSQRRDRVVELLERVGLPAKALSRFPHEFSGGQRQRVGIARALAVNPSVIVCDEPLSALDVSIQSQILTLLKDLQQQAGIAYLFITHALLTVPLIAHRVSVMYRGQIVESGDCDAVFGNPKHDYTRSLLREMS